MKWHYNINMIMAITSEMKYICSRAYIQKGLERNWMSFSWASHRQALDSSFKFPVLEDPVGTRHQSLVSGGTKTKQLIVSKPINRFDSALLHYNLHKKKVLQASWSFFPLAFLHRHWKGWKKAGRPKTLQRQKNISQASD